MFEIEQPVELVGREFVFESIRIVDGAAPPHLVCVDGEVLEHRAQLDAILAQRDPVWMRDARVEIFGFDDFRLLEPLLERVIVESRRPWADGARKYFRLRALPGAIGIGDRPPAVLEDECRRRALIERSQHAGVEQNDFAVESALHVARRCRRVAHDDARNAKCRECGVEIPGLGVRVAEGLAAIPGWAFRGEEIRLLRVPHIGRSLQVGIELGVQAPVRLIESIRGNERRQPAVHEGRIVDDDEKWLREEPRAVLAARGERRGLRVVARRLHCIEFHAHGFRLRRVKQRPRLLAQRVVFLAGERRIIRGGHITQIANHVHHFVVAEHEVHGTARGGGFAFEPHHEVEHLARIRPAVEEIPEAHEMSIATPPMQRIVDDSGFVQDRDEFVIAAVYIRNGHDPAHALEAKIGAGSRREGDDQRKQTNNESQPNAHGRDTCDWRRSESTRRRFA